jgi:hypothetical protein
MNWLDTATLRIFSWYSDQTSRNVAPAPAYLAYRQRFRAFALLFAAGFILHAASAPRSVLHLASIALLIATAAAWLAIGIPYVLAWDELQRRALAESGAIAAAVMLFLLMSAALLEPAGLPRLSTMWWFAIAAAAWYVALPLVRRQYES